MAFGKSKEPKEPKEKKEKKAKVPKEKKPKAPKEKKPPKPKKEKPPKAKRGKKGKNAPEEVEGLEGEEQEKKKKPIILILIPIVVILAAAAIIVFVVLPKFTGDADPDATASVEPQPPELPETIPIGDDVSIVGMTLDADESEAVAEKSKRVTYIYSNLVDAGKAAETYAGQLAGETPAFSVVDEEFVRQTEKPDYTTAEGMVLLARNVPVVKEEEPEATATPEPEETEDPDSSAEPTPTPTPEPEPEPTPEPITYVHTVRITWSPGMCVVTADEEEGMVTQPPRPSSNAAPRAVTQRGAREILESLNPVDLGLPGDSMELYEVLPMDGTEMVDDKVAIRMHVYNDKNAASSNDFMGSFLMTIDGEHLFRVDPITDEIIELEYTPR